MAPGMIKHSAPRGLTRLAFRLPIWLYHLRLGWLLGQELDGSDEPCGRLAADVPVVALRRRD